MYLELLYLLEIVLRIYRKYFRLDLKIVAIYNVPTFLPRQY